MNKYIKTISFLLSLVILGCVAFCFDILMNSAINNLDKPLSKVEDVAQHIGRFTIGYYLLHRCFKPLRDKIEGNY